MSLPLRFRTQLGAKSGRAFKTAPKKQQRQRQFSSGLTKPVARKALLAGASVLLVGGILTSKGRKHADHVEDGICGSHFIKNTVCGTSPSFSDSASAQSQTRGSTATSKSHDHMIVDHPRRATHEQDSSSSKGQEQEAAATTEALYTEGEPICFVIGTGIDASHNEFKDGQVLELSEPSDDSTPTLQRSTFHIPKDVPEHGQNCWAHETKVASVIGGKYCGMAPGTKLVDVRIAYFNPKTDECTYEDETLERRFRQIKKFLEANPDVPAVINLSMGSGWTNNVSSSKCRCREEWVYPTRIVRNRKVDRLIREVYELGTLTVAAAGNNCSPAYTYWPASNPYVLTVGAVDRNGAEPEFNNFGAAVGLLARGVNVRVAYRPPDEYDTASGTSYAAPYVAAYACTLLENAGSKPGLQTKELRPGALKSLLYSHFHVEQKGLTQPERYRRRSDGEAIGEDDEDEDEAVEAGGDGKGDDGEGKEPEDGKETPKSPDTKKDEEENPKAGGGKIDGGKEDDGKGSDGKGEISKKSSKDDSNDDSKDGSEDKSKGHSKDDSKTGVKNDSDDQALIEVTDQGDDGKKGTVK